MDLKGASRTSGGLFRGHAVGNALNSADLPGMPSASNTATVRGLVSVYQAISGPGDVGNPADSEANFKVKVTFTLKAQELCDMLLKQGSINQGKYINS